MTPFAFAAWNWIFRNKYLCLTRWLAPPSLPKNSGEEEKFTSQELHDRSFWLTSRYFRSWSSPSALSRDELIIGNNLWRIHLP